MLTTNKKAWQALALHQQQIIKTPIAELFKKDPQRFNNFSLNLEDLLLDFSKQHLDVETVKLLCELAQQSDLSKAQYALLNGAVVNKTEQRAALHTELRNPQTKHLEIKKSIAQMANFVAAMQQSNYTDIIVLGIGGSDLGPRLVCEALAPYAISKQRLHFVANVDADTLIPLLKSLEPKKTICLVNSKTFTTIETLSNAKIIQTWLGSAAAQQTWAITANGNAAEKFGIQADHIFMFWDWVGGRYSVWSAVGLSIALYLGMDNFQRFLNGAHAMDQHFATAPFAENMPVMLALIGIWQINFNQQHALCVQPYADGLQLLPAYLQQLEMESNGKSAADNGAMVNYQTAPVIWGGVGCNGQHAYMQLLHQGTQIVPVDFLVARRNHAGNTELQQLLVASCLGQSQALMTGRNSDQAFKVCPGNRPSTTIMFDALTPEIVGKLIALYEHKVFVQGIIWQIQSFDQWGVQLGKELIKDALDLMIGGDLQKVDSSTAGLLRSFLAKTN